MTEIQVCCFFVVVIFMSEFLDEYRYVKSLFEKSKIFCNFHHYLSLMSHILDLI